MQRCRYSFIPGQTAEITRYRSTTTGYVTFLCRTITRSIVLNLALKWAILTSIMLVSPLASAQEVAPEMLLKALTAEVTGILKQSRGHLNASRTSEMNELVERKIVPLFDFTRMTRTAVAHNWSVATPQQRTALTAEFKTLLVRTYSTVLRNYRDQAIDFKAMSVEPGATQVTVNSVVRQAGSAGMPVDYEMEKTAAGWKVYEIRFDGVKLTENYRSTFAARVKDVGIDGLIKALSDKNRENTYSGASPTSAAPANPG